MFHLAPRYWLSERNTLCSDEGAISVTDRDECYLALPFVREVYPSAADVISQQTSHSDYPVGCFVIAGGGSGNVYFNSHEIGGRDSKYRDICKANGK